jgi:ribonuclease VapC
MSAANVLELHMVASRESTDLPQREVDTLLVEFRINVQPVTLQHLAMARAAFDRFGKGNHAAKLNYGDCFAYALAKAIDAPLLYKGDDFARTDIASGLA